MNRKTEKLKLLLKEIFKIVDDNNKEVSDLKAHISHLKKTQVIYLQNNRKLENVIKNSKIPKNFRKDMDQLDLLRDSRANNSKSGERNGKAKLTRDIVGHLRMMAEGAYIGMGSKVKAKFRKEYASIYGVTSECIYNVIEGLTWKK